MPLQNLSAITAELLAAGRAAATPALVVQHGTLPQQRHVQATLGTLVDAVQSARIERPAVVVLGDVVTLADALAWFRPENYPLLGQRVLVTRPRHQAADFMASLRDLGAEPVAFPTIEIRSAEDTTPLDDALRQICRQTAAAVGRGGEMAGDGEAAFDWLVVTSANGVTAVWERLAALGLDSRCLASVRVAAIGPATAATLQQYSITPDLIPVEYTAEGVLDAFDRLGPVTGQRFLLARADIARATLADGLRERGAIVSEIPAYRTVPVEGGPTPPPADIVTFTSSSTVQGYVNCLAGADPAQTLKDSRVVCIGPITAKTAQALGVPVAAVAKKYTIEGLLKVLKN
jgi:uroporphyrinogen III methyltransferase/synthase